MLLKCTVNFIQSYRYLIKFLAKLSEYQDANKMTPGNMAIVLGPNLLWTHNEPYVFLKQLIISFFEFKPMIE